MKRAFLLLVCSLLSLGGVLADSLPPAPPQNLRLAANGGNRVPMAVDDSYQTYEGRILNVPAPGLLANDNDPDGDALAAELVAGPSNGTLVLSPNGSFSYTSTADFIGSTSFTYRANDGELFSNVTTVSISVASSSAAPWFEDSFEGQPPKGWKADWTTGASYAVHDTTDEQGAPPGGDRYAYRQYFLENSPKLYLTADHTTNTYTSENHGLANGTVIRFGTDAGGVLPAGLLTNRDYVAINVSSNTFQIAWSSIGDSLNIDDNGTPTFFAFDNRHPGGLKLLFGGDSPVPLVGDGHELSFSYYLKFHPDFDYGSPTGHKLWGMETNGAGNNRARIWFILQWDGQAMSLAMDPRTGHSPLSVNVGSYSIKAHAGEWMRFDWFFKMSNSGDGLIKGWIDGQLHFDYTDITTHLSEHGDWDKWFTVVVLSNNVPQGENQRRYMDFFRIGPGAMVLNQ